MSDAIETARKLLAVFDEVNRPNTEWNSPFETMIKGFRVLDNQLNAALAVVEAADFDLVST